MTDLNQEALRAARERDTAIELCALLGLQPQKVDGGGVALWEEYLPHARALLRLADRTRPAPSQTAVEPVAGELEILLQWLPKLIAVLGSKPEHVDDVARLARMHALIPEQTAAREATAVRAYVAEKERDEAQGFVERLQAALFFWMPGVRPETDTGLARSAGDDAYLLSGYSGPELGPCWGDDILATVATLKARVAELEVDDDGQPSEQQEWRDYDADC